MSQWQQPLPEKQEQLRQKMREMLKRRPLSLRSMARDCNLTPPTLSSFMRGDDVNWVSYCKIEALVERRLNDNVPSHYVKRATRRINEDQ